MMKIKLKKQKKAFDRKLLIAAFLLTVIGLVTVTNASAPAALYNFDDKFFFAKQQFISGLIGVIALGISSRFNYKYWEKYATYIFAASVLLIVVVLIPQFGVKSLGARRWLVLGPISLQPSEIIKLTLSIYLAKVAASNKKILAYLLPVGIIGLLIMLQPDFGTTIVIMAMSFAQIFVSGINLLYVGGFLILGTVASFVLTFFSSYRRERLLTFIKQTQDPLGSGYHIRQILIGLGSGGLFGIGLGKSRQKFLFLPEAATDSIFAVFAEEVGFIGAALLIIVFAFFIYRGLLIVRRAPDRFSKVLAVGIVTWIGGQAFLNIGSMVALIPITGIPLPFISYGGSSLITVMLATGILLNISRHGEKQTKRK